MPFLDQVPPVVGTVFLLTGWKAHHLRSSSVIFPGIRLAELSGFAGQKAPFLIHVDMSMIS